ncbi:MAG: site-specific DNA-methyltransferase [Proteobacteria bacterium]|nr:site-specific DNA-methyltransferase [Pseudomonadota bacterium]
MARAKKSAGSAKSTSGRKTAAGKTVETLKHEEARRKNIPTAEFQPMLQKEQESPRTLKYPRNTDLDPQLVWRGKDEQDWSDLVVPAPPLYIQEKVHPKALIDDLLRESKERAHDAGETTADLFGDFNGIPKGVDKTEFYQHDQNWSNRMILGDSLQVMASLAEREGLRGKVQCIYFDPPYGIKFNSNFQWSTTTRDVKDGNVDHITRQPEQVKAFRDTWRHGVHSYLTYLRDRLTVARDLLADSGSIFLQIGDENVHRARALMDEVLGTDNFVSLIAFTKGATGLGSTDRPPARLDYLLWYSRIAGRQLFRPLFTLRGEGLDANFNWVYLPDGEYRRLTPQERTGERPLPTGARPFGDVSLTKPGPGRKFEVQFKGQRFDSGKRWWGMPKESLERVLKTGRVDQFGNALRQLRFQDESTAVAIGNLWGGLLGQSDPIYVVQTNVEIVKRCILMTTDPGDLVLDPTCGSGTAAYVAEHWGRRWITIDTSRVALTLARARIMGAKYPFFLLADSREGQMREAEVSRTLQSSQPTHGNIRHGFVYDRVPHITLKSIANNAEIDVIWDKWQRSWEPLRDQLNSILNQDWADWSVPRHADEHWPNAAKELHKAWREARSAYQKEIDTSIAAKAEFEYLYDKPFEDRNRVRVAGPFTVESLSPHRVLAVGEDDDVIDPLRNAVGGLPTGQSFPEMILDNLRIAGVQQAHRQGRIAFTSLAAWPGHLIVAEGKYLEGNTERRAGIFVGPEFGTAQRADLVSAAREAADAGFDVLITCAFNYEAHTTDFNRLGRVPVLKARMNADLHMATELKNTGKGNLFVIFGEPDIEIIHEKGGRLRVKIRGVDVFDPQTGEIRSEREDGIASWFVDTDYNEESFFVRQAYFLGSGDPYDALKASLKAEINEDIWATLYSNTSRSFSVPKSGRIAVKAINHLGDEVMKIFRVRE